MKNFRKGLAINDGTSSGSHFFERPHMKFFSFALLLSLSAVIAFAQPQDSTAQKRNQPNKQKMDKFIDADGDGICDNRARGLGFSHTKQEAGKMNGNKKTGMSRSSTGTGKQFRGGRK